MKFVDIKNDIAFRKIFGNENKKEILISFLNAVLEFSDENKIVSITILNPFQLPELMKYKTTVIDVKATDQNGHYYIIEMQVADKENFAKRIQLYTSKAYTMQIVKGDDYHLLKPTIFIGILDFNFLQSTTYLTRHITCNPDTKEQVLKDSEYYFIELLKFNKTITECGTLTDKWLFFIKNAENLEVIPDETNDKGLNEAYHDADKMTWTRNELELYDYAKMRERDEVEERDKAYSNGAENEKIEVTKKCFRKGLSIDDTVEITELTYNQVESIYNELKNSH